MAGAERDEREERRGRTAGAGGGQGSRRRGAGGAGNEERSRRRRRRSRGGRSRRRAESMIQSQQRLGSFGRRRMRDGSAGVSRRVLDSAGHADMHQRTCARLYAHPSEKSSRPHRHATTSPGGAISSPPSARPIRAAASPAGSDGALHPSPAAPAPCRSSGWFVASGCAHDAFCGPRRVRRAPVARLECAVLLARSRMSSLHGLRNLSENRLFEVIRCMHTRV